MRTPLLGSPVVVVGLKYAGQHASLYTKLTTDEYNVKAEILQVHTHAHTHTHTHTADDTGSVYVYNSAEKTVTWLQERLN